MKRVLWLAALLTCVLSVSHCLALGISMEQELVPFGENPITVTASEPGYLTLRVVQEDIERRVIVEEEAIPQGRTVIPYDGLAWNEEPFARSSKVTVEALFHGESGAQEEASVSTYAKTPKSAIVYALPERSVYAYERGSNGLRIDASLSAAGQVNLQIVSPDDPDQVLWAQSKSTSGEDNEKFFWKGTTTGGKALPAGDYELRAFSRAMPERILTVPLTLLAAPEEAIEPAVTGSLIPADDATDEEIWDMLMQPAFVINGGEGGGCAIHEKPSNRSKTVGMITCATVGVTILDLSHDTHALIGAWRQEDGTWVEGYVEKRLLMLKRPNDRVGVVVDKRSQELTVFMDGERLGTAMVSTGLPTASRKRAETRAGVYFTASRQGGFMEEGYRYAYPIRIDGGNLIHQIGYQSKHGSAPNFTAQIKTLGQKASHGCIRVDCRVTEASNGINAYWLWTHLGRNVKIIVIDG